MIRTALIAVSLVLPATALAASGEQASKARILSANKAALREPVRADFVGGVQVYRWEPGALYRLYAAPGRVSGIALEPGEALISVAAGDTARWSVADTASGAGDTRRVHILVKPFAAGLDTNLVITTDKRTYRLELESVAGTAMTGVAWRYPGEPLLAIAKDLAMAPAVSGLELDRLSFVYAISGDEPDWRPLRVFDDGRQTFIQFPASIGTAEAPPLFALGPGGEPQLVNYRMKGRYYVVDRLFRSAELRLGKDPQQVVRISRTARGQTGGEGSGR